MKTRVLSSPDTHSTTGSDTPLAILNRPLGPEFVQRRAGPGGSKLSYLSSSDATYVANLVLGNDRWSTEVLRQEESEPRQEGGKWVVDAVCRVRVTVHWATRGAPTFHESTGYGGGSKGAKTRGDAVEMAVKEAETDAYKRALCMFGEATGNCFYDKNYLAWIEKMRTREGKHDPSKQFTHEQLLRKSARTLPRGSQQSLSFESQKNGVKVAGPLRAVPPDEFYDDVFEDDVGFEL
ncbi:rad52/22 family double-strand break repair protein [Hirsutella rhossiliensis]|uniref:Rad52/22 family double-strand break repair protein n=1 Tax=Hirsutella rhossiliensis TaxID=111463 RepID=A0A9P8MSG5_9HYPO|nr:rad52/22 family double-strand break repair protein [Hirsutella rhossiliensis]KAH0961133.1 rad52/22 family double-strand break repair protein [Hirsutella rhossiliensis]